MPASLAVEKVEKLLAIYESKSERISGQQKQVRMGEAASLLQVTLHVFL